MNQDPNQPDQTSADRSSREPSEGSVPNPFAPDRAEETEKPQLNISPRRAAMLGLTLGLVMVGLLVICFLGSVALAACTEI